ncbi:unnamed protein product [Didymodactylos carnosus]|uniref:NAD(P)(+)--arginine ADP-ribosyltransferase n=1 Tax=Didymodactylos carnosus TaxID=1234261 RepID=A0A815M125_9BILA|nr:unnamed protein product [Didymodactylos carnosus]CAF4302146.1 unnamed protein product [Didymodactylos carnosus]
MRPSFFGKTGTRTLFSIECTTGKSIMKHSYFNETEKEVILMPGTYFDVVGQLNPADGLHIIHIKEIQPKFPLIIAPFVKTETGLAQEKEVSETPPAAAVSMPSAMNTEKTIILSEEFKLNQPLTNFHKKEIDNKRVTHWSFKLQDTIPQITEVKYLPRAKNTGPDSLSKYPISSISSNPTLDNDWCQGTQIWKIKSQRLPSNFFTQLNAAITHQQAKRLSPVPSSTTVMPSIPAPVSSTNNPLPPFFDLSLDRISKEQMADTNIIETFNLVKQNPSKSSFIIRDVVVFKLLPRGKTKIRLPYIPKTLIKDILFTHHDHPLAGYFGIERTCSHKTKKNVCLFGIPFKRILSKSSLMPALWKFEEKMLYESLFV